MKKHGRSLTAFIILIGIPVYVLCVFVSEVFAPEMEVVQDDHTVARVTFVGDMMFDRYIRESGHARGYDSIFTDVLPMLGKSDVLVGNLEGPITSLTPVSDWRDGGPDHYRFTFATTVADTIAHTGFDAVSLGNNHIFNFGEEGVAQTKTWLAQNNLGYFGAPDEVYVPWRYASSSPTMVIYAFDTWHSRDVVRLTERIAGESEDVFVVVYAHWGNEYEITPTSGQRELAHRFIDAGADFVVGSHPHVIQTKEMFQGKWIYYSLGNFVFDQYFSPKVQCGAIVNLTIQEDLTYTVEEGFVELARDGTTKMGDCTVSVPLDE
ncbi:MAG: hypothetical protein UU89_C0006G0008 [Parcubacteria group bacterium GW2011_GWC2_42_11]|nr:MAG: hypothetical protein UU89_C0006G0008 [Parcubacteria group bacterium GW2011_GWC2_42_11]